MISETPIFSPEKIGVFYYRGSAIADCGMKPKPNPINNFAALPTIRNPQSAIWVENGERDFTAASG
jgi:hypothetical protein